jgi:hypothetical protein
MEYVVDKRAERCQANTPGDNNEVALFHAS